MKTRGFTLLEMVVALSVTLVLAATMLIVVRGLLGMWQRAQGGGMGSIEAKLVLDQIERDLQSAVLRVDGSGKSWIDVRVLGTGDLISHGWKTQVGLMMKPDTESGRLLGDPANRTIQTARFGLSAAWLRLISNEYDSAKKVTLPVAISYQVVRAAVSSASTAPVRYSLFRGKMGAQTTFDDVLGNLFTGSDPAALTKPDNGDAIASNVVDFGIWIFASESLGQLTQKFPTANTGPTGTGFPGAGVPTVVDVMIRVLDEEGATLLEAMEEGRISPPAGLTQGNWWWSVVEAHSRVFTRRVELKAGVL